MSVSTEVIKKGSQEKVSLWMQLDKVTTLLMDRVWPQMTGWLLDRDTKFSGAHPESLSFLPDITWPGWQVE